MAFKTCEEYVLAELALKDKQLEEVRSELNRVLEEGNEKITKLKEGVDYGNKVIGLFAQLQEIKWVNAKNDKGEEERILVIAPKQGAMRLDRSKKADGYVYDMLAPFIGDEEVQKELGEERAKREAEAAGSTEATEAAGSEGDKGAEHTDANGLNGSEKADAEEAAKRG